MPQLFSLPVLSSGSGREVPVPEGILPLTEGGKSCGTGCDSGGTHAQPRSDRREAGRPVEIPLARRRLNLDAIPSSGTAISSLDMDLTVECNLRCTYCLPYWDGASLGVYKDQFRQLADLVMDDLRRGVRVNIKGFDDYATSRAAESRPRHACGAGRGMALIDIHGDIWPCHRWNKAEEAGWRMGSIYEQFNEAARAPLDTPSFSDLLENDCHLCPARKSCGGGCPAENLEDTGKVHRRHPNACAITRIWHRVGEQVYQTMMAEGNPTYQEVYCATHGTGAESGDPYA